MSHERQPNLIPPGDGPVYDIGLDRLTIKIRGEETLGAFAVVEGTIMPGGGPPPHVHQREDELFYILEGEFEFLAGERTFRVQAGAMLHGPKGIPHTFKNVGSTPGRMLVLSSPPGFERFVAEVGEPVTDLSIPPLPPNPAQIERLLAVAPKYGIALVGPPPEG